MARLREWHYNKNSMLELVRSQKAELPMVAGAEELIMSASDIISSEINIRIKNKKTIKYIRKSMDINLLVPA